MSKSVEKNNTKIRSRNQSMNKNRKKTNNKNYKIVPFDDSELKEIDCIGNFVKSIKLTDPESVLDKNPFHVESAKQYLDSLISLKQSNKFLKKYSKYQFLFDYNEREPFQKYIKSLELEKIEINDIIKKNSIERPIKEIFRNIGLNIINFTFNDGCYDLKKITTENIYAIFVKNNVFFNKEYDFNIPVKNGNYTIQYYSLLNDIWFYFDLNKNNAKKLSLIDLVEIFNYLQPFFNEMNNQMDDKELISILNYLINIIYIYKDSGTIDISKFLVIIDSCLPFNKEKTNNIFNEIKYNISQFVKINGECTNKYKNEISGKEDIEITTKNKRNIKTKAEFINWRLGHNFVGCLFSDHFSVCMRYPYNCEYNYLRLDTTIRKGFDSLLNKMIKSSIMKQGMLIDDEARKFKYLYSNDKILQEVKDNTHYVCLPFDNYFGYSDKTSFDIYIKSDILISDMPKVLVSFDNILRTYAHEYKEISLIYYKMSDGISSKTPRFSLNNFTNDRSYMNDSYNMTLDIIQSKISNLNKNSRCFNKTFDEYGDLLEYALFGFKVEAQIFKVVLFCLNDKSWDLSPDDFDTELKERMKCKTIGFKLENQLKGFGKVIYDYFDFVPKDTYVNNLIFARGAVSNSSFQIPDVIETPRNSHHMNRNEDGICK